MTAKILPYNAATGNAIRNVLFIFQYATPVPAKALEELKDGDLHNALKAKLPKIRFLTHGMKWGRESEADDSEIQSYIFERFNEKGEIAVGLNVQSDQVSVVCGEYTSWVNARESVYRTIQDLREWLQRYEVKVNTFTLQYLDEFKVVFGKEDAKVLTCLLSSDSSFLARNFVELEQEFHSHHGFFMQPEFQIEGRLLHNVNIGVTRREDETVVQIQTIHKYEARKSLLDLFNEDGGFSSLLFQAYEYLHQENKRIVGNILTAPVKEMIRFEAQRTE
ncbi:hypothetical protein [Pseudomonas putida]|uniref:TIGR04255 family protein n=1 Tax=Pseudomonas putida TaxID=303 RepID=A0A8I1EFE5_PSEPU|nr:hypothetical protein [Pseudomonas putida]MBI6884297.1 hypothetical protein [Pseudomonas putida]